MIKKLYAIYDKKANNTIMIVENINDLCAIRDFSTICQNKDSMVARFPDDYCLKSIGTVDTESNENMIKDTETKTIAEATDYTIKE